jgi:putative transposase
MPRHARTVVPDVATHIVQRGNNRGACFFSDADRLVYLAQLGILSSRHGCAVHAYCLMGNHVHLLVTPLRSDSCAQMMKNLGQRYVQYVNRTYDRTGGLWEGRFRSCVAQSERYVLACYRYIESNPVRAAIVDHPGKYRWSSYRANAEGRPEPFLTPHAEFVALGKDEAARRRSYRGMFDESFSEELLGEIRAATNGGHAFGSQAFRNLFARARTLPAPHERVARTRPGGSMRASGTGQAKFALDSAS